MMGILGACMYPYADTGIRAFRKDSGMDSAIRPKHAKNVCAPLPLPPPKKKMNRSRTPMPWFHHR